MLYQRIMTSILLIPIILLLMFVAKATWFASAMAVVTLLGAWEWSYLAGWRSWRARGAYLLVFTFVLTACYFYQTSFSLIALLLASLWWLVAFYWVLSHQQGLSVLPKNPWLNSVVGGLILIPAWLAVIALQKFNPLYLLLLFLFIWGADSGAYFVGRRFGKQPLADKISPKKTWEGVWGALATVVVIALGYTVLADLSFERAFGFVTLSVAIVFISILGDLLESLFKRQAQVKDSGNLLPGHGGILDRIDSLTAAAPFFTLSLSLMEGGFLYG